MPLSHHARTLAVESEGFHDPKRGKGVVSGVEKLTRSQVRRSPVACCDVLRFSETLFEFRSDSRADADLPFVAPLSEYVVEVEDGAERNAQTRPNLSPVIPQSESDLQDPLRLQQIRDESPALWPMKLEDEGPITEGKLDNVRTANFLPGVESGFRFGVESSDARHHDLPASLLNRGNGFRDVNAFEGKPLERLQQSGFSFRWSKESHVLMLTAAAFRCRGKRAESRVR